jgi:hypothetical protein
MFANFVPLENSLTSSGNQITALEYHREFQNAIHAAQVNTATMNAPPATNAGQANIR